MVPKLSLDKQIGISLVRKRTGQLLIKCLTAWITRLSQNLEALDVSEGGKLGVRPGGYYESSGEGSFPGLFHSLQRPEVLLLFLCQKVGSLLSGAAFTATVLEAGVGECLNTEW